jgi:hypothetical protein
MGPVDGTLSLAGCLDVVVEDYVLGDLDSMAEIEWKETGAVCYPMVMTVLAGCELLGRLAGAPKGLEVDRYWTQFMAEVDSRYGELAALAQHLLRHELMHSYFTKPGVGVVRGKPEAHLRFADEMLILNCLELANDFRESYERHAKPHLTDDPERRARAEQHVATIASNAAKKSEEVFVGLRSDSFGQVPPGLINLTPSGTGFMSGASGPG